ncbi:MAG: thermonuclease family protein [Nitrospirae bacterium]|nr:thermonuclease family protein [Nitrospirota bacterium]
MTRSRRVRIGGGVGALLAVLWLILSSALPARQETACAPVSGMAVVQEVIDGDTVQLTSGERIRYLGIDTPEVRTKRDGRWVYAPEPFAEDASALNRRLVEGRRVRLEADREPCDRYRRHLAYLFVDDLFVNAELVRQGLAVVKIYPPNDKYRQRLQDAQTGAQARRTGLWAADHPVQRADPGS